VGREGMLAVEFTGLGCLGVRTERFEETVRFFRNVMGLQQIRQF
jgi:catechol 2,3-dioxygenase-like lactoylglutathione lyase family enzyme